MPKSTRASKNSKTPPRSSRAATGLLAALTASAAICAAWLWWFHAQGYLLWYGDALAHLTIGRRLFDSRTPGWEQIGTVWLPLPHAVMSWFARDDGWWRSGLAGALPAALAQTLAGVLLFATLRRALACTTAALVGMLIFLLNPNSAYLGSIPMTEPFFFCAFFALAWCAVSGQAIGAGLAACAATLIRYDGWFLIPFVTLWFWRQKGRSGAILFASLASLGPLYWLGHNWFYYSDPLEFYWGPYSNLAINRRAAKAGVAAYPGDHQALAAVRQFSAAAHSVAGVPLAVLGAVGLLPALWKRAWWPAGLFAMLPAFYCLSVYGAGSPIFVPHLEPYSYYNTRYGLAALPLFVFGAAAWVAVSPPRVRALAAPMVLAAGLGWWLLFPKAEAWICWKESQVNSEARRAWTAEASAYLREHYDGGGILLSLGDQAGALQQAGIPLIQSVHEGNGPLWLAQVHGRPEHFLHSRWVLARAGDPVAAAIVRSRLRGPRYELVKTVSVRDTPAIEIHKLEARFPSRVQ